MRCRGHCGCINELDGGTGVDGRQRRRHEGIGGAEHRLPLHPSELQCRQRAAGPARKTEARQPVPGRPALLEGVQHAALGPLLGIENLGPELEELGAITMVEPNRELARVDPACLCGPYGGSLA